MGARECGSESVCAYRPVFLAEEKVLELTEVPLDFREVPQELKST